MKKKSYVKKSRNLLSYEAKHLGIVLKIKGFNHKSMKKSIQMGNHP